jgi:hypothetical protein
MWKACPHHGKGFLQGIFHLMLPGGCDSNIDIVFLFGGRFIHRVENTQKGQ